jgi:hypothetical protein
MSKSDKQKDPNEVILTEVVLSYPNLFKARAAIDGGTPKFSASFILDKTRDRNQIESLRAKITALAKEKLEKVPPADRLCLKDGANKEDIAGYGDDVMFVSASSDRRPAVVDRGRRPVAEADDTVYGGCVVNAVIRLWAQNNQYGKRINASLEAVQFVRDGERFGAPPVDPEDSFPDLEESDKMP